MNENRALIGQIARLTGTATQAESAVAQAKAKLRQLRELTGATTMSASLATPAT